MIFNANGFKFVMPFDAINYTKSYKLRHKPRKMNLIAIGQLYTNSNMIFQWIATSKCKLFWRIHHVKQRCFSKICSHSAYTIDHRKLLNWIHHIPWIAMGWALDFSISVQHFQLVYFPFNILTVRQIHISTNWVQKL